MTYTLEAFVEKIDNPVIVDYKGKETVFLSGKEAIASTWPEKMRIISIYARNGNVVLKMEQVDPMLKMTWVGEGANSFSD